MLKFSAPLQDCAQGPRPLIWDLAFAFPSLSFGLIPVTIKLEFNRAAVRIAVPTGRPSCAFRNAPRPQSVTADTS